MLRPQQVLKQEVSTNNNKRVPLAFPQKEILGLHAVAQFNHFTSVKEKALTAHFQQYGSMKQNKTQQIIKHILVALFFRDLNQEHFTNRVKMN